MEGLRPEPGVSQSFSSAQRLSQPEVGPQGGKQELQGSAVSPGCDGNLCLGLGHPQGLRFGGCTSVPISVFPSVRGWVGIRRVGFTPSQMCAARHSFAMIISSLELVLLLSTVHREGHASNGFLFGDQRQSWASRLVLLSPSTQSRWQWQSLLQWSWRSPVWAGGGTLWQAWQAVQSSK